MTSTFEVRDGVRNDSSSVVSVDDWRRGRIVPLCAVASLLLAWQSQAGKSIRLPRVTGQLSEPFTSIAAVRELADGRVLVADARDVRIVAVDFRTGSVVPVGRRGNGPGKYRTARNLFAIGGDSSLLVDPAAGRWVLFAGVRPVRTTPPDAALVRLHRGGVVGADARGGVWRTDLPAIERSPGGRTVSDSGAVIRTNVATGEADPLVRVRLAPRRVVVTAGGAAMTIGTGAFQADEQAVPFPDGSFAVARIDPYRVEIHSATGTMQSVFLLPHMRQAITGREKGALLPRAGNPSLIRTPFAARHPPFESE